MSSVPGPIIRFTVDAPQLSGAVSGAMQQIRSQSQTTGQAVADDWKRYAAQIRAAVAQSTLPDKEILAQRQNLVLVLRQEIDLLDKRTSLTKSQLSDLKAMTLELERQSSILKGGPGLTAGTQAFLGQVSGIGTGLVSQLVGRLGANLFGVAGGSQLGSAAGGIFSGLFGDVSKLSGVSLALGGITTAFAAMDIAALKITGDMLETVQSINNMAAATGLTVAQVQVFNELAKEMDLDAGAVANSVSRLAAQLGQYLIQGKSADEATQMFVRTAAVLGVTIKDSTGNLRPIVDILGDFADKVNAIPDASTRSSVEIAALGIRAKVLADAFNIARIEGRSFKDILQEIGDSDVIIKDKDVENLQKTKDIWDELARGWRGLVQDAKTGISNGFLHSILFSPMLGDLTPTLTATATGSSQTKAPAVDVAKLQQALALDKQRTEEAKKRADFEHKIWEEFDRHLYGNSRGSAPELPKATPGELIQRFLQYGTVFRDRITNTPPDIGIGFPSIPSGGILPSGIGGTSINVPRGLDSLLKQINDEHDALFTTQYQKDKEYYDEEQRQLADALKLKLVTQKEFVVASKELEANWGKTLLAIDSEFVHQAGSIFDDLVNGRSRQAGNALAADVKNIALSPIKNIFEQTLGGLLGTFLRTVNAPFQQGGALGGIGGFFAKIFSGSSGQAPKGTAVDPVHVVIGGVGNSSGATSGGIGDIIGDLPIFGPGLLNPTTGITALLNGSASSGSAGGGFFGSIFSSLSKAFTPDASKGAAFGGGNLFGSSALGGLGSIGGGLLMSIGARQGGGLGALEGAAGGALTGFIAGGPIGAAIGAAVGAITDALAGPSFQEQVAKQAWKQAYYAPPSETFSFASNGSIASTLATGFSQSGSSFSRFGLPSNTPFYASAITGPLNWRQQQLLQEEYANLSGNQPFGGFNTNPFAGQGVLGSKAAPAPAVHISISAIDAKGVSEFFNEHGDAVSAILNGKAVYSSSSRFGSSVRAAANLP